MSSEAPSEPLRAVLELPGAARAVHGARARQPLERRRRRRRARASARASACASELGCVAGARLPGARHGRAARARAGRAAGGGRRPRDADGQATALRGRRRDGARAPTACRSRSAASGAVAMVHAGWRGCAAGVLEEGVRALRELGGERRRSWRSSGPARALLLRGRRGGARGVRRRAPRTDAATSTCGRSRASGCWRRAWPRCSDVGRARSATSASSPTGAKARAPGARRGRVVELIAGLRAERVRANLERVRERDRAARRARRAGRAERRRGRDARGDQVRRAPRTCRCWRRPASSWSARTARRTSQAKVAAHGELFEWDFIGQLQSRRVRLIVPARAPDPLGRLASPRCASSSATASSRARACAILIEVNVAGEPGKAGIAPEQLDAFIARSPRAGRRADDDAAAVASDPEDSRRWFAALRELADEHGLRAPVDGHLPGLPRRGRGGRDDRADRHETVRLSAGSRRAAPACSRID